MDFGLESSWSRVWIKYSGCTFGLRDGSRALAIFWRPESYAIGPLGLGSAGTDMQGPFYVQEAKST